MVLLNGALPLFIAEQSMWKIMLCPVFMSGLKILTNHISKHWNDKTIIIIIATTYWYHIDLK